MNAYSINTFLRRAHFLAQIRKESDGFCTLTEYASGKDYEGRNDLGNIKPGDGVRYRGRGLIQLTGRTNYRHIGKLLNLPLEENPDLAIVPENAVKLSCLFWQTRHINHACDADDVIHVTRLVNGRLNGLAEREIYLRRAKAAFSNQPPATTHWNAGDFKDISNFA